MVYFEKSQPAPDCLINEKVKADGDYKCGNVLNKIESDFKKKCYICEVKEPGTINVEHFRPHMGDNNLKFDWNNLYWSCSHCNNIKSNNYGDLIDCTDLAENIEDRIKLHMKPFPMEGVEVEAMDTNASTLSTVDLLNKTYNGSTKLKTLESSGLRNKILYDIIDFQHYTTQYLIGGFDEDHKNLCLTHIKRHLSRASNFTAFKRWIVKENEVMRNEFEKYFD